MNNTSIGIKQWQIDEVVGEDSLVLNVSDILKLHTSSGKDGALSLLHTITKLWVTFEIQTKNWPYDPKDPESYKRVRNLIINHTKHTIFEWQNELAPIVKTYNREVNRQKYDVTIEIYGTKYNFSRRV
ncbi:MAG TPA: hypothetical protein DDW81_02735 [Cryomorphaceae bacterium]|nr:hypothetical protein [Owenweeksia sp.]HBF18983.1 hypothetical protein [Cryomorphaceae bacterium]